jgi:GT2 family glycosyltransferase
MSRRRRHRKRNVVCIAGMHRSGTSLIARLVNLCGLYLGPESEMLAANSANEMGYWENRKFLELNEEILSELGTGWDLPVIPARGWEMLPEIVPLRGKAAALIQGFDEHLLWGWKDPRNSITLPFWKALIPDLKLVVCLRHPVEVARSLIRRGSSSKAFGLNLWATYHRLFLSQAESSTAIITHYESYFYDARRELSRLVRALGMDVAEQTIDSACQAVMPSLRHERRPDRSNLAADVPGEIMHLYADMCAKAGPVYQDLLIWEDGSQKEANGYRAPLPEPREGALRSVHPEAVLEEKHLIQTKTGEAQLFLPTQEGYSEDLSCRGQMTSGQWVRLVFPMLSVDRDATVPLRFDPIDRVGVVEISGIEILSEIDGSQIWQAIPATGFDSLAVAGTAVRLPDPQVLRVFSYGGDAQVYFPEIPELRSLGPMRLEVWLQFEPDLKSVANEVIKLTHLGEVAAAEKQAFENELSRLRDLVETETGETQLFLPTREGHRDEVSHLAKVVSGQWVKLVFPVHSVDRDATVPLRFDPIDRVGVVEINEIKVLSEIDNSRVWQAIPATGFDSLAVAGTAVRLPDPQVLRVFSYGRDAQVYFPEIPKLRSLGPLRLEVWLRFEPDLKFVAEELVKLIRLGEVTEARLVEMEQAAAQREEQLSALKAEMVSRQEEFRQLGVRLKEEGERLALLEQTANLRTVELAALLNSTSWRLTAPLRRLAWLRSSFLWGLLRWVYWTGTLQLPHRLRQRKDMKLIKASGLFDVDFYLNQYPDAAAVRCDPAFHFVECATPERRNPNPLFDTAYYLDTYPDAAASGLNPLIHYVRFGAAARCNPSPRFDTGYYLDHNPEVAESGINPLLHYLRWGAQEGRSPKASSNSVTCPSEPSTADGSAAVASAQPAAATAACCSGANDGETTTQSLIRDWEDYLSVAEQIKAVRAPQLASFETMPPKLTFVDKEDIFSVAKSLIYTKPKHPLVSIIIPVHNNLRITVECLLSIKEHTDPDAYEIVIVSEGPDQETQETLAAVGNITVIHNRERIGYTLSCNKGAEQGNGEFLLFLNNDTQVTDGWLKALLDGFASREDTGAVAPKVLTLDGRLQEAGAFISSDGTVTLIGLGDNPDLARYNYIREVDCCSGVCLLVKAAVFREIKGFDTIYAPSYYGDVDLCFKLRARGLRILYTPHATIVHHSSATMNKIDSDFKFQSTAQERQEFLNRWQVEIDRLNQVKLIAFYLPQFHPIPENDLWWGKGYTEWRAVTGAQRNYEGHYQPHLPADLGFYDLRVSEIMDQQVELAKRYGIHGFCYYYYWFHGKRLLEMPLDRILATGKPDFPFCICWANENWTRRWDGDESHVLIGQRHSDDDDRAVMLDMMRYLRHANYMRVEGKPLLLIYRVSLFPDFTRTAKVWREICRTEGIGEIYLVMVGSFELSVKAYNPQDFGADASVEFPPHHELTFVAAPGRILNPRFAGMIMNYKSELLKYVQKQIPGHVEYRCVMPGWDNTPRRQDTSCVFEYSTPGAYQAWLEEAIRVTREQHTEHQRIVFVNAWNEWGEGNHLEPDRRFGHRYLEATRNALERWLLKHRE